MYKMDLVLKTHNSWYVKKQSKPNQIHLLHGKI